MIQEDYVSFETAKLLKENGFDEKCIGFYSVDGNFFGESAYRNNWTPEINGSINAPTLQMTMKWLREKGIIITIDYNDDYDCEDNERYGFSIYYKSLKKVNLATYATYEETCKASIKYCLTKLI